jgi:hypothetical protein
MARPKKNTELLTGVAGILFPIVSEFLKIKKIPDSWGQDEADRVKAAHFMAYAAAKPEELDAQDPGTPLIDYVEDKRRNYFFSLFTAEPDFALRLMSFVRKKLRVGPQNLASNLSTAMAFLREGAMARFKQDKGREATDGELSAMIKTQHGPEISPETFGDARRAAVKEDAGTEAMRRHWKRKT